MNDSGHGSPTSGKIAPANRYSLYNSIGTPTYTRCVKTFELDNVFEQTIEVEHFLSLLNIEVQGDGMYMYCLQNIPDNSFYVNEPTNVTLWIIRSNEAFDHHDVKGAYAKTVVVKDIAYHFFSNYYLNK